MSTSTRQSSNPGRNLGKAIIETLKAPQWCLLLGVLLFGFLAKLELNVVILISGGLLSMLVLLVALHLLGVESLVDLFKLTTSSWKQLGTAALLLITAGFLMFFVIQVPRVGLWVKEQGWSVFPAPDQDSITMLLVCSLVTVAAWAMSRFVLKMRKRHESDSDGVNRRTLRAAGGKRKLKEHRQLSLQLESRSGYWKEAVATLFLADIAFLPGAFGWNWIAVILLSVALPIFVISVRFRYAS